MEELDVELRTLRIERAELLEQLEKKSSHARYLQKAIMDKDARIFVVEDEIKKLEAQRS